MLGRVAVPFALLALALVACAAGTVPPSSPSPSTAASSPPATSFVIYGRITDAVTGAPIDQACVTVGVPGQTCFYRSDAAGDYAIDLSALAVTTVQMWDIYVIKPGYQTFYSGTFVVDGRVRKDVALSR